MGNYQSQDLQYQHITGLEISEITSSAYDQYLSDSQSTALYRRFYWLQQNHEKKAFRVINLPTIIENLKKIGDYEGSIYAFQAKGWFPFVLFHCNNVFYKKSITNLTSYCDHSFIDLNPTRNYSADKPLLQKAMIMSIVEDPEWKINWVYEVTPG